MLIKRSCTEDLISLFRSTEDWPKEAHVSPAAYSKRPNWVNANSKTIQNAEVVHLRIPKMTQKETGSTRFLRKGPKSASENSILRSPRPESPKKLAKEFHLLNKIEELMQEEEEENTFGGIVDDSCLEIEAKKDKERGFLGFKRISDPDISTEGDEDLIEAIVSFEKQKKGRTSEDLFLLSQNLQKMNI